MPILVEELTVWDICFRWAGYDPRKVYFRIPLEVENYARILIDAIHKAELSCESITLEKREFADDEKKLSFYYWVDDFFSTTSGQKISRDLLKWAFIGRYDLMQWCKRMNAPLPEFWFPSGWNLEYELPENELSPGHSYIIRDWPLDVRREYFEDLEKSSLNKEMKSDAASRPNQRARIACQTIAINLWKTNPTMTIADMVKRPEIQDLGGAKSYSPDVVRRWLSEVASAEVKAKKGRPSNKNTTKDI